MSSRCREALLALGVVGALVGAIDHHYWTAGDAGFGVIGAAQAQGTQPKPARSPANQPSTMQSQTAQPQNAQSQQAQSQHAQSQEAQSQNAQAPNASSQDSPSESGVPVASRLAPIVQGPLGPVPGPMRNTERAVPNPYQGDAQAMLEGRRMFVAMNCSGCHGGHAGGGMGPSLRDQTWIYGSRSMDIFDSISNGRANGMPAWGTMLPQQQIWQIVAYIQSMRTPQEPEPPE